MRKLLSVALLTAFSAPVLAGGGGLTAPGMQALSQTKGWQNVKKDYENGTVTAPAKAGSLTIKQPTLNSASLNTKGQYVVPENAQTIEFMFHTGDADFNSCLSVGLYDNDPSTVLNIKDNVGWQVLADNTKMVQTGQWISFTQNFEAGDDLVLRLWNKDKHGNYGHEIFFNGAESSAVGSASQYSKDKMNHAVIAENVATASYVEGGYRYDYTYSVVGFEDMYCCPDNDWDDVVFTIRTGTVTAVPEPETYAMLLAGLGMIGTIVRRRRNK
ncbi:MAG: PEP-CTERM sorting domain-containing protein [Azoarcus sp.]|nr:PEP-CTERM sorting domain-containing protein [Azoarcus sp.]